MGFVFPVSRRRGSVTQQAIMGISYRQQAHLSSGFQVVWLEPPPVIAHRKSATVRSRFVSVVCCALMSLHLLAVGQERPGRFEHISPGQGLSQSVVLSVHQDREGYIWFGTEDGLNKFDGYSFTVYRHRENDTTSLSSSSIRCIAEDSSGNLWIGTWDGGLNRYDPESGAFVRYRHDPRDSSSLSNDRVVSVLCDSRRNLWISTWGGGLNLYDPATKCFRRYRSRGGRNGALSTDDLYSLTEDRAGNIWIGSFMGGLNVMDPGRTTFRSFINNPDDPRSISDNRVTAVCEDSSGILWIGTWGGGLNRFDRQQNAFERVRANVRSSSGLPHDVITCMHVEKNRRLWVGTMGGGLAVYDILTGEWSRYSCVANDPTSLSDDKVFSLDEDAAGIIWVGTAYGVSKFDPRRQGVLQFRQQGGMGNSLSSNDVFPIHQDSKGIIWIGTYGGGLNRFDPATGSYTHFRHDPSNPGSLSSDFIYAIAEDPTGGLWIGTDGGGLDCLTGKGASFRHFQFDPHNRNGLRNNYIRTLLFDRQASLWIGTGAYGIDRYEPSTGKFASFTHEPDNPASLGDNEIQCFLEDREGSLWIGTVRNGLQRFDRTSGAFIHYAHRREDSSSLSHDHVQVIAEDRNGTLWIGTNGGGLNRFNRKDGTFTRFGEEEGLPNEVVYGIVEDDEGYLWLSTNNGLCRFQPGTGRCKNFDVNDGLQSNEFNYNSYAKGRDGTLYFGGVNGFNAVRPEQLLDNPHIPAIVLTTFTVMDVKRSAPSMPRGLIELAYNQNFFSFEFAALDYSAPSKNRYAYKLEGIDPEWVQTQSRRYVSYAGIQPGEYVFRVKGSNADGVWNDLGVALQLIVLPPLWQTWWFRLAALLVLGSILAAVYRLRVSRILELERMRTRIASDLHDDIGSTLTKIAVQSEMIQTIHDEDRIRTLSKQIGNASREIIGMLSDIVWSIDARKDTLGDLFTRMQDFAIEVLTPRQILARFEWDHESGSTKIPFDIRQNIYLIFKEAVNNIARHSDAHHLTCRWTGGKDCSLVIEDDGSGMRKQTGRGGFGLQNMKMRAGRIGATFNFSSDHGVRITISGISL